MFSVYQGARCLPPPTSPILSVCCQALIANKEVEAMQGVGVELVVVGVCLVAVDKARGWGGVEETGKE